MVFSSRRSRLRDWMAFSLVLRARQKVPNTMTDPASPAAVTEERMKTIRDHLERHGMLPEEYADEVLAAYDARGLELARLKEKVSTGIREHARTIQFKLDAEREWTKFERRALAAEARLAQANEALGIIDKRIGHTKAFLDDEAPFTFEDQKHLDANTPERAYWHHGYMMALRDVKGLLDGTGIAAVAVPTPPAQSAGEALDPAGTGEGVIGAEEVGPMEQKLLDRLFEDHKRGCAGRNYVCTCGFDVAGDALLQEAASHIRAQASALAEARRSALEEAAKVCDRFNGYMAQLAAKAIRALTEPQHD